MAKTKVGRKKGSKGPTKEDRIEKLTASLPKASVKVAQTLAKETPYDVLTLASLLRTKPTKASVRGLGQTIDSLPPEKQEKAREMIAAIKALA